VIHIYATLPANRYLEGRLWALDGTGRQVLEAARCRGKADNVNALAHDNALRDPLKTDGDHPYGTSHVIAVVPIEGHGYQAGSFGPFFLKLLAIGGDIFLSKRPGLGIHGGPLAADGVTLRATYGCLRVDDATDRALAALVSAELARGEEALFECAELRVL
jgi:hypothetical protein